jgi:DNA-directed RNA polymerase
MDLKKGMNALLPNTSHYIDSTLMYNISNKLIEQNIPFKTLHDAYYLHVKYINEIREIYINEYINLFEQNILEKILINVFLKLKVNKD